MEALFYIKDGKDLDKIFELEELLLKAGVEFDTGYDVKKRIRLWYLDDILET